MGAVKIAGFHSGEVAFKLGILFGIAGGELGLDVFFDFRFVAFREIPATESAVRANERELGGLEVLSKVLDEVDEVFFVSMNGIVIDAIVPSLVPTEAAKLEAFTIVVRIVFFEIGSDFFEVAQHLSIMESFVTVFFRLGIFFDARREEVVIKRTTTPRGFDEEHGIFELITNDKAEPVFWSDVLFTRSVTDAEPTLLGLLGVRNIHDPDIIPDDIFSVFIDEMAVVFRLLFEAALHRAGAALELTEADHIRLTCEDENFQLSVLRNGIRLN